MDKRRAALLAAVVFGWAVVVGSLVSITVQAAEGDNSNQQQQQQPSCGC